MTWLSGRSSRGEYWITIAAILAIVYGLPLLGVDLGNGPIVVWFFIYARRLHDLGRTGWWGPLAVVASAIPLGIAIAAAPDDMMAGLTGHFDRMTDVGGWWYVFGAIGSIVVQHLFTLGLGLMPGQAGDNRFGPPPAPLFRKRAASAP